jgi:hypothetical protein
MNELQILTNRLKKINIDIDLKVNVPWIYLDRVNGNTIKPKNWINANHGYVIAWYPIRTEEEITLNWQDIKKTFELIRKYR